MAGAVKKPKTVVRSRSKQKAKLMTKAEMVKKMLADQQIIREARQKGISYEELKEKYGFEFATV